MSFFRRARTYGISRTFVAAMVMAMIGLAGSRPPVAKTRPSRESNGQVAASVKTQPAPGSREQQAQRAPGNPWTNEQVMQPEGLAKRLSGEEKPLILHVGVVALFRRGHIPGSRYVGQASTDEGIETLKKTVQGLPRNRGIVLYCGCCPWNDCPNIRPAFKALQDLRFTKVQVLYLPKNFSQDWEGKGLPVEKG